MAFIYVTEHTWPTIFQGGLTPVVGYPLTTQKISNIASSTLSVNFQTSTMMIAVHTDSICSIAFGTAPTATVSSKRMAANTTEYFAVKPGDKLAVTANT